MKFSYPTTFKVVMPIIGIIFGINAFVRNPSADNSYRRLSWMREAMSSFVCCNDPIASSYENAKYGGSVLSKTVLRTIDSDTKREEGLEKMQSLGWRKVGERSWCNGDVLLRIVDDRFQGRAEKYFNYAMTFDASSISRCGES